MNSNYVVNVDFEILIMKHISNAKNIVSEPMYCWEFLLFFFFVLGGGGLCFFSFASSCLK